MPSVIEPWLSEHPEFSERSPNSVDRDKLLDAMISELPSACESLSWHRVMRERLNSIEQAAERRSLSLPFHPLIASLRGGLLTSDDYFAFAAAERLTSGEYAIICESELFIFLLLISKVISMGMPLRYNEADDTWTLSLDIDKNINENNDIGRRFYEVLYAYIVDGHPSGAPSYSLDDKYQTIANALLISSELFIVAHEYAHILMWNRDKSSVVEKKFGDYAIEHMADILGAGLMLDAMMDRFEVPTCMFYWGAEIYFLAENIAQRCISVMIRGNEDNVYKSSNHPSFPVRCQVLREVITENYGKNAGQLIQVAQAAGELLERLWLSAKPRFIELYEAGERAHPKWSTPVG